MRGMLPINHFLFFFSFFKIYTVFSSLTPNVRAEGGRWKLVDLRQRDANWLLDRLRRAGPGRGPHSQPELWQLGKCVKVIQMRCRGGRCNYAKVKKRAWPSVKCPTRWEKIRFIHRQNMFLTLQMQSRGVAAVQQSVCLYCLLYRGDDQVFLNYPAFGANVNISQFQKPD